MLLQLVFNQSDGQLCRINRNIDFPQDIRQSTDMILVAMGNDKAFYLLNVVFQIGHIRDYQVDPQHVVLRKGQTTIHDNNTVFILEGSNIHSDLLKAAQRNDL